METANTVWITIFGMACVTYLSRVGGLWLMNRIPITPKVEAWLKALPGTILISIVTPLIFFSGKAEALAGLAVIFVAWRSKSLILAMVTGIVCVWGLRNVFS